MNYKIQFNPQKNHGKSVTEQQEIFALEKKDHCDNTILTSLGSFSHLHALSSLRVQEKRKNA